MKKELTQCQNMLHCKTEAEDSGSIVMTCAEIGHLIATGNSVEAAKSDMAKQILEYAKDFYNDFDLYSNGQNTKSHLPFVQKVLRLNNIKAVEDIIICFH